jgi:hypothetical protein
MEITNVSADAMQNELLLRAMERTQRELIKVENAANHHRDRLARQRVELSRITERLAARPSAPVSAIPSAVVRQTEIAAAAPVQASYDQQRAWERLVFGTGVAGFVAGALVSAALAVLFMQWLCAGGAS